MASSSVLLQPAVLPVPHRRPIRIGLLWHSAHSGNLGVAALTVANLAIVSQAAADLGLEPRFLIIGMRDDSPPRYIEPGQAEIFGVDTRALISPGGYWAATARLDCLLDIGAGDSFADIYGFKRFMFLWLTKALGIARQLPLMLSPQTIGPFTRTPYRQLARVVLNRATVVVARDDISLEALRSLAPSAKGALSADVAFALPYEDRGALRGQGRIRVGVNVSGLLFNEASSGSNRFGLQADYAELTRAFLTAMSARDDVELFLLAHVNGVYGDVDDDAAVADRLSAEFPKATRVADFRGPCEAKSFISSLDFLTAGRMHACIAALSSGVPVVPIAYSRKFSGLFGMLDYPWIVPVMGLDTQAALAFLEDCLARRQDMQAAVLASGRKAQVMLETYRSELRTFLAAAATP